MSDGAALESERQENDAYERHLAAEIIAMIHNTGSDPQQVLRLIDAMLNVKLPDEGSSLSRVS